MEKNIFKPEELRELEMLEIKGGTAEDAETSQYQCSNNVAGCACTVVVDDK